MKDGILLLSKNKSDAVVKTDLAGNMIWKTNLGADSGIYNVQLVDNHIVLYAMLDDEYGDHFIAIDSETGAALADVISLEAVDYYYSHSRPRRHYPHCQRAKNSGQHPYT